MYCEHNHFIKDTKGTGIRCACCSMMAIDVIQSCKNQIYTLKIVILLLVFCGISYTCMDQDFKRRFRRGRRGRKDVELFNCETED